MRVLVCGSREFSDVELLNRVLDSKPEITCIIEGEAAGADLSAKSWAMAHNLLIAPYRALWGRYGRSAGMMRNRRMLYDGKPDLVVAFKVPDGPKKNVGTNHMIAIARKAGVPVEEYYEPVL